MIPRIILEYPRIRGQAQALRGIQIHINRIKIGEDGGGRGLYSGEKSTEKI